MNNAFTSNSLKTKATSYSEKSVRDYQSHGIISHSTAVFISNAVKNLKSQVILSYTPDRSNAMFATDSCMKHKQSSATRSKTLLLRYQQTQTPHAVNGCY